MNVLVPSAQLPGGSPIETRALSPGSTNTTANYSTVVFNFPPNTERRSRAGSFCCFPSRAAAHCPLFLLCADSQAEGSCPSPLPVLSYHHKLCSEQREAPRGDAKPTALVAQGTATRCSAFVRSPYKLIDHVFSMDHPQLSNLNQMEAERLHSEI